jgi:hypothetical protein
VAAHVVLQHHLVVGRAGLHDLVRGQQLLVHAAVCDAVQTISE